MLSWRSLGRVIRATRHDPRSLARDIHATAHATQLCLGAFAFFIVFAHVGYDILPHMIVALTVVVSRTAEAELLRIGHIPAPSVPSFHRPVARPKRVEQLQNFC
jgi:hypothetical protein